MIKFEQIVPENGIVIGEIACGHEGDLTKIFQLIDTVSEGGASIIKFQIFSLEERAIEGEDAWNIFKKLVLDEESWMKAVEYSRKKGLSIISDVYGDFSLNLAIKLGVDGFKIHSEDLLNTFFISKVAQIGKPILIGVGAAHRNEIQSLIKFLHSKKLSDKVILMTGVQTFPTPLEAHSISEVKDLIDKYSKWGVKVGFSDHAEGDHIDSHILPLLALAAGSCIIEKHVTVKREDKWIDYHSALDSSNFKKFMENVKRYAPLVSPVKEMTKEEKQYRKMFKKTAVSKVNLAKGKIINEDDIIFKKNTNNSIPYSALNIINKELIKDIQANEVLIPSVFKNKVGGIIVARCSSSRLPNKALMKIDNRESIALVIDRMKRCKNIDQLILATSTDPSDDRLEEIAHREGIYVFRGSLDNVSSRFYEAAKFFNLSHFVRITGDAILCDEVMTDIAIESHLKSGCDVTFIKNMPLGTNKEVISFNTIESILDNAKVPSNTEYLEYYLENNRNFSINYVISEYTFDPMLRITLDYQEDYQFFQELFSHFNKVNPKFTIKDALIFLNKNPDVAKINMHLSQKYFSKDLDLSLSF